MTIQSLLNGDFGDDLIVGTDGDEHIDWDGPPIDISEDAPNPATK